MTSQSAAAPTSTLPKKDLYEIGEIPPLGHVPKNMYAWTIRRERHGPPEQAMQLEVVPTWEIDSHEVLVLVMAAGVNYNGVWAGLGQPISVFDVHSVPYHIAGLPLVREDYQRKRDFYRALTAVANRRVYSLYPFNYYTTNIDTAMVDAYAIGTVLYPQRFADVDIEAKANAIYAFLVGKPVVAQMKNDFGTLGQPVVFDD